MFNKKPVLMEFYICVSGNIGKACSKQPSKEKYTNSQKTCMSNKTCSHSHVFLPEAEKFSKFIGFISYYK